MDTDKQQNTEEDADPRMPVEPDDESVRTVVAAAPIGVTAIIGHSAYGPVDTVVEIRSESDFNRAFGDWANAPILAAAVNGFFANGGQCCWILNLGPPSADPRVLQTSDLDRFDEVATIELVCAPGFCTSDDYRTLVGHCERLQTRLAILDTAESMTTVLGRFRPPTSGFGAVYTPWLTVHDPSQSTLVSIPPSGHMAGLMARVAAERGVHKSPANEPLRALHGLSHDISKNEQDVLYPRRMNCIRALPKIDGIRPWGAQTLSQGTGFQSISSFRLFSFIVRSLTNGCPWLAGAHNDADLWSTVRESVSDFLAGLQTIGALAGETRPEGFFVRCDETLNDVTHRERGLVALELGLALSRPGRFYTFKMGLALE